MMGLGFEGVAYRSHGLIGSLLVFAFVLSVNSARRCIHTQIETLRNTAQVARIAPDEFFASPKMLDKFVQTDPANLPRILNFLPPPQYPQ
jgi:hypothetical protein